MEAPEAPEPDETDLAVRAVVLEELASYDRGASLVRHVWSDGAGAWFVEVQPDPRDAATLSVSAQGDTLSIVVGNICFEVFGRGGVRGNLSYLREIVAAVAAGRVEEAGPKSAAFGRIYARSGTIRAGAVHAPVPWRLRRRRRYAAYARRAR